MNMLPHTFGGLRLSGDDAKAFEQQLRDYEPTDAAKASAERARVMAEEFKRTGRVMVRGRKAK